MKNKKKNKKKISKTEKKLRNQLRYQRSVINKESKSIEKMLRENNYDIDKRIGKKTIGTLITDFHDQQDERFKKINSIVSKLEKRFKYNKKSSLSSKVEYDTDYIEDVQLGKAWDIKDIINYLKDYMMYKGKLMKDVKEKMISDVFKLIIQMTSESDLMAIIDSYDNIIQIYIS